jgi:hypothetical protein
LEPRSFRLRQPRQRSIAQPLAVPRAVSRGLLQAAKPALPVRALGRARAPDGPAPVRNLASVLERPVPVPTRPTAVVP